MKLYSVLAVCFIEPYCKGSESDEMSGSSGGCLPPSAAYVK